MAISDINSTKFNNIFVNILVWVIDEDDWATPPLAFEFIDTSSAVAVVCQISKPVHLMRVKWKALPNIGDKLGYATFLQSTLSGQALFIMLLSTINYKFQKKFFNVPLVIYWRYWCISFVFGYLASTKSLNNIETKTNNKTTSKQTKIMYKTQRYRLHKKSTFSIYLFLKY